MPRQCNACAAKAAVPPSRQLEIKREVDAINDVLLREWDPIRVSTVPSAQDEYDTYSGRIHSLLTRGVSREELTDHLWRIEQQEMGFPLGSRRHTEAIAQRLLDVWRELNIRR